MEFHSAHQSLCLECLIIHIARLFSQMEDINFLRHVFESESHGPAPTVYDCVSSGKERMPQNNKSLRPEIWYWLGLKNDKIDGVDKLPDPN